MYSEQGNGVVFDCQCGENVVVNAVDACWRVFWWGRMQACHSLEGSRECFSEFLGWLDDVLEEAGVELRVKMSGDKRGVG